MKMTPKQILSRCVDEFESKTQVELVVLIRKSADSYFGYVWFYTLLAVQFFWVATLLWNESFSFEVLAIESLLLIVLCYVAFVYFEIIKFFVPRKTKDLKVKNYAEREFTHLGVANTRLRSGLLIVFSHWEDECVVLGDIGIHERISKTELDAFKSQFKRAFLEENLGESVGSMIRSFGVFWHAKWPNEDDVNEIVHAFDGDLK